MSDNVLHVLYQSDNNYAAVSAISITSLLENNKHLKSIIIHYCGYKLSRSSKDKLGQIVASYPNASVVFIDAAPYIATIKRLGVKSWHGLYITWLKLQALADMPSAANRILFLNGHTIVNGKLDELISMNLGHNVMALAYDGLLNDHKKTIGLDPKDGYFNCGVMLINMHAWRDNDCTRLINDHLLERSDYVIADQDLCNVLFKGRIKLLDSTYNFSSAYYAYNLKRFLKLNKLYPPYFYSYEDLMSNFYSPKIIHSLYGIQGKPWEINNRHPQRHLWRKYFLLTPWHDTDLPKARKTLIWTLYELLPSIVFMRIYAAAVYIKFGR